MVSCNGFRFRDILYPGFLQSFVWATIVSLFSVFQNDFMPISFITWLVIGLGVIAFSMGSFISTCGHSPFRLYNKVRTLPMHLPTFLLIILIILFLPVFIKKAYMFYVGGPFDNGFMNLRYALSTNSEQTGGYGILKYLVPIAFFVASQQILRVAHIFSKREKVLAFISIVAAVTYGLLSSGRSTLIMFMLTAFSIPIVLRRIRPIRSGSVFFFVLFIFFVLHGILMGKGGSLNQSWSENIFSMLRTIETYLLSSIPALNFQLHINPDYGIAHTFRTIFALLHAIGFDFNVKPLVKNFVGTPFLTNVYTLYQPYYLDYGLMALPFFQFGFGFLHGALYRKATIYRPASVYIFFFSLSMCPLFLQFFNDQYFSLMSQWMQYLTYSIVFCVFLSRRMPGYNHDRYHHRQLEF